MNKKELTGADIRTKLITPAIAGPDGRKWDVQTQLFGEHYFTRGRVVVHDRTGTPGRPGVRLIPLDGFPTPDELRAWLSQARGYTPELEAITTQDCYDGASGKRPHYYQVVAVNRTVEAIARGEKRILLVMATGTAIPAPPSRSSGASGRPGPRSASFSSSTATSSDEPNQLHLHRL